MPNHVRCKLEDFYGRKGVFPSAYEQAMFENEGSSCTQCDDTAMHNYLQKAGNCSG
jgi:hypothetical protein